MPAPRPNVIWVLGDPHRAQALGSMGDANLHTPTLDRFAAEGTHFTAAVGGCLPRTAGGTAACRCP